MGRFMNGCMVEGPDGWMDGWMVIWMDMVCEYVCACICVQTVTRIAGWIHRCMR